MADGTQVVEQAYEAFGRGDIPGLLELLSDDVDWNVPEVLPQGGSFKGREDVGRFFQGLGERWEGFGVDVEPPIADGGRVAIVGRGHGTVKGAGEASYGFTHVFDVEGEQIVRFREFADPDETIRSR
jgi:uncharacterized protein